jgi:hypothetical protein
MDQASPRLGSEELRELNPGERIFGPDIFLPIAEGAAAQSVRPEFVGLTVRQVKNLWPILWIARNEVS